MNRSARAGHEGARWSHDDHGHRDPQPNAAPMENRIPNPLHGGVTGRTQATARSPITTGGSIGLVGGFATETRVRGVIRHPGRACLTTRNAAPLRRYQKRRICASGCSKRASAWRQSRTAEGKLRDHWAVPMNIRRIHRAIGNRATVSTWTSVHSANTRLGFNLMEKRKCFKQRWTPGPVLSDDLVGGDVMLFELNLSFSALHEPTQNPTRSNSAQSRLKLSGRVD